MANLLSSELEFLGLPLGWYFNWTFLLMPEKWPYISRTVFICINLDFFSSIISDSTVPLDSVSKSSREVSRISWSCWGFFISKWVGYNIKGPMALKWSQDTFDLRAIAFSHILFSADQVLRWIEENKMWENMITLRPTLLCLIWIHTIFQCIASTETSFS